MCCDSLWPGGREWWRPLSAAEWCQSITEKVQIMQKIDGIDADIGLHRAI
jgi:hypothetical protein